MALGNGGGLESKCAPNHSELHFRSDLSFWALLWRGFISGHPFSSSLLLGRYLQL